MSLKPIKQIIKPVRAQDGAGVELNRVFGNGFEELTDPFLLLDHFNNSDPTKASPGFPWHPHRGIETISYILDGGLQHQDSLGNTGVIRSGDVQWMTAGKGIIHQEMPTPEAPHIGHGFQLWANLPAAKKMTSPRYQDIPSLEIPEVTEDDGTKARIITGSFWGQTGPVTEIATNPLFVDFNIPPHVERSIKVDLDLNSFIYLFEGSAEFRASSQPILAPTEYMTQSGITDPIPAHPIENRNLILFDRGDEIRLKAGPKGVRFLLISGRALREPIAWHGPIVMNTRQELYQAFQDFQDGRFV
ncbi:pirin family protein [Spirochaeta cellobiosiphila]|uniref:pirin family protein n=1 Tax=Spirochaeta cellobiosiphila TaxID=504483 RepID=UPI00041DBEA4|nr:pirin family protein [Spirochaeta cellobiosiphila]